MNPHRIKRTLDDVDAASIIAPANAPTIPKARCIVADPPWCKEQSSIKRNHEKTNYSGAINHYNLMSTDLIKAMPVASLAAENAHLYLWVTNNTIADGIEVAKAWGFRYVTMFHWLKPRLGTGNYFRSASETCLFAVRGKLPPKCRTQINWMIGYPTVHSEKPREFISIVERVSPGPYLELFCRKRPASNEKWYCWGNETEGGADFFIPGFAVPDYSFNHTAKEVR